MAPFLMYARRDVMTPAVLRDGRGSSRGLVVANSGRLESIQP